MKTKIFGFVFLILSASLLVNCDKDDDTTILTLTIASEKPVANDSTYSFIESGVFPPLYIYKQSNPDWKIWPSCYPILGFDEIYQKGYEYVINVKVTNFKPQMADQISSIYNLSKVVSVVKKESKDIPPVYLAE